MRIQYFILGFMILLVYACKETHVLDAAKTQGDINAIAYIDELSKKDTRKQYKNYYSLADNRLTEISFDQYNDLAVDKLQKFTGPKKTGSIVKHTTYSESGDFSRELSFYRNDHKKTFAIKNTFGFIENQCLNDRVVFCRHTYSNQQGSFHKVMSSLKTSNGQDIDPTGCALDYPEYVELKDKFNFDELGFLWLDTI